MVIGKQTIAVNQEHKVIVKYLDPVKFYVDAAQFGLIRFQKEMSTPLKHSASPGQDGFKIIMMYV